MQVCNSGRYYCNQSKYDYRFYKHSAVRLMYCVDIDKQLHEVLLQRFGIQDDVEFDGASPFLHKKW